MKKLSLIILLAALLTACASATATNAPRQATPGLASATPSATTAAPLPSLTPDPTAVPGVLLLVADQNQPGVPEAARAVQRNYPLPAGAQQVKVLTALAPDLITPEVKAVVILSPLENLEALVAGAPGVLFVAVAAADVPAHPNLSVIQVRPENLAYVAGFTTIIISADWRAAGLLPANPASLQQAFTNGASYYCGHCTPINGPIVLFPLVAATDAQNAPAQLAKMKASLPETLYVDPAVASPDLFAAAALQKLVLVGARSPDASVKPAWAVTIQPDLLGALKILWPDLVAGKGGKTLQAGFSFGDINPQYFSPGKQRLVQDVIDRLSEGSLLPLSPNK